LNVVNLVRLKHPIQESKYLDGDILIKEDPHRPLTSIFH